MTVAELQAKTTPAERAGESAIPARPAPPVSSPIVDGQPVTPGTPWRLPPVSSGPQTAPLDGATEPVRVEDVDEPRLPNRLAKTIAATLAAVVICGVITAVAALNSEQPNRLSPSPPTVQPALLVGPAVLHPNLIIQQLGTRTSAPPTALSTTAGPPTGRAVDEELARRVVREFYEDAAILERRNEAYGVLADSMQTDWVDFERAWRGTRRAEVVRWLPDDQLDGVVLAAIWIEKLDGAVLHLVQRFDVRTHVDGTVQPRIVHVELLSALNG